MDEIEQKIRDAVRVKKMAGFIWQCPHKHCPKNTKPLESLYMEQIVSLAKKHLEVHNGTSG